MPLKLKTKREMRTEELKDAIDFGSMEIPKLFRKLLIPTLMGMVFSAVFVITDGIFVGNGIGSDGLAAVNITAPVFMLATGIGLMFGLGGSVIASIHLSHGKVKVARIIMTQAITVSSVFMIAASLLVCLFAPEISYLLGASERLEPLASEYLYWYVPFLVFSSLLVSGSFFVRLDGSPKFSMWCTVVPAVLNIFFDYLFIFPFGWGMMGAALATGLGTIVGGIMILVYLWAKAETVRFIRIKQSWKSFRLTCRNVWYMCKLGISSFLCECTIAYMMLIGNYVFISYLGEDGVASFSIACYFFPIIFMVYNAIGQSAQPILSYNLGAGLMHRVKLTRKLAFQSALGFGTVFCVFTWLFRHEIVGMFIDSSCPAFSYASDGLPLFAIGFIFFAVNIVSIVYFQSMERPVPAMWITVMRGFVFMTLSFLTLPLVAGTPGIWLSVPLAEFLTLLLVLSIFVGQRLRQR